VRLALGKLAMQSSIMEKPFELAMFYEDTHSWMMSLYNRDGLVCDLV
jgi:hypothetical protein